MMESNQNHKINRSTFFLTALFDDTKVIFVQILFMLTSYF
jgi:hypothetical protein